MAPKKRPATTPTKDHSALPEAPLILTAEALADLHFIEPIRTRKRVISAFNELFVRVVALERAHMDPPGLR